MRRQSRGSSQYGRKGNDIADNPAPFRHSGESRNPEDTFPLDPGFRQGDEGRRRGDKGGVGATRGRPCGNRYPSSGFLLLRE